MSIKTAIGVLCFFLISSIILIWKLFDLIGSQVSSDNSTKVVFCDVGQGDAILITSGDFQILIDGGPNSVKLADCLDQYIAWSDKQIELLVVTHLDSDHIGGLEAVFSDYLIARAMIEPDTKETKAFLAFKNLLLEEEQQGMKYVWPKLADRYQPLDFLEYQVLWWGSQTQLEQPKTEQTLSVANWVKSDSNLNGNERSIGLKIKIFETEILLTGDMGVDAELALLTEGLITDVDVLKAGHHGSKHSSQSSFLTTAAPEHVVFSSAKNNAYGHPHLEVISRVEQLGSQIWRTDVGNDVVVRVEPSRYWVEYLP